MGFIPLSIRSGQIITPGMTSLTRIVLANTRDDVAQMFGKPWTNATQLPGTAGRFSDPSCGRFFSDKKDSYSYSVGFGKMRILDHLPPGFFRGCFPTKWSGFPLKWLDPSKSRGEILAKGPMVDTRNTTKKHKSKFYSSLRAWVIGDLLGKLDGPGNGITPI